MAGGESVRDCLIRDVIHVSEGHPLLLGLAYWSLCFFAFCFCFELELVNIFVVDQYSVM